MKIVLKFSDGLERTLKSPDDLWEIDEEREALFVFDNGQVFCGYSDGEVDEDDDFAVRRDKHGIALPFNRLVGWCYKDPE